MTSQDLTLHHAEWGSWKERIGTIPILFSAPHNAEQVRDGLPKAAEPGSLDLALELARAFDASAMGTVPPLHSDPNWDAHHPYVLRVKELLPHGFVLDLHMMRDRGFPACIGTGTNPELVEGIWQKLENELENNGLETSVGWPFGAGPQTVTSNLQSAGIKALQLELTPPCFDRENEAYKKTRESLEGFVRALINGSLL
jgi:hypothetical protein